MPACVQLVMSYAACTGEAHESRLIRIQLTAYTSFLHAIAKVSACKLLRLAHQSGAIPDRSYHVWCMLAYNRGMKMKMLPVW